MKLTPYNEIFNFPEHKSCYFIRKKRKNKIIFDKN